MTKRSTYIAEKIDVIVAGGVTFLQCSKKPKLFAVPGGQKWTREEIGRWAAAHKHDVFTEKRFVSLELKK